MVLIADHRRRCRPTALVKLKLIVNSIEIKWKCFYLSEGGAMASAGRGGTRRRRRIVDVGRAADAAASAADASADAAADAAGQRGALRLQFLEGALIIHNWSSNNFN